MPVLVTVHIPHPLEKVDTIEAQHPAVLQQIMQIAGKYMLSHRRFERNGEVMDLDEYASEADYRTFLGEAGDAIQRYSELLGGGVHDVVWSMVGDGAGEH